MTSSQYRFQRDHAQKLAIMRELHGCGFIANADHKPQLIADMCNDGLLIIDNGFIKLTKAGEYELAEAAR